MSVSEICCVLGKVVISKGPMFRHLRHFRDSRDTSAKETPFSVPNFVSPPQNMYVSARSKSSCAQVQLPKSPLACTIGLQLSFCVFGFAEICLPFWKIGAF